MGLAIQVNRLSKAYRIGEIGSGTVTEDVQRWIGTLKRRKGGNVDVDTGSGRASSKIVWSLKDLNFEVEQGRAVALLGRNGAGKSTLLKLLSRITIPTHGEIRIKGRVASLLEVGTGFNQDLTGRENIFLNGAILGMRKKEIVRRFDEIVSFSGIEKYIDTPVKRYSSGMYVRLGFAVAAHLNAEILIVDEVLAVGDAAFQKKSLDKMRELVNEQGRTIFFVSHNIASVMHLCDEALFLKGGKRVSYGITHQVASEYMADLQADVAGYHAVRAGSENSIIGIYSTDREGKRTVRFNKSDDIFIHIELNAEMWQAEMQLRFILSDANGRVISISDYSLKERSSSSDKRIKLIAEIPKNFLRNGSFTIGGAVLADERIIDIVKNGVNLDIVDEHLPFSQELGSDGVIFFDPKWKYEGDCQ